MTLDPAVTTELETTVPPDVFPAVVRAAISALPPVVRDAFTEALGSTEPLLLVDQAEAIAAEAAAAIAIVGAEAEVARSTRVIAAVEAAREREEQRWTVALAAVATVGADTAEAELDDLARRLGAGNELQSAPAFNAAMEDEDWGLCLGPREETRIDHGDRLSRIAVRRSPASSIDLGEKLRVAMHDRLMHSGAGRWINGPLGPAVLLGDGTAVSAVDGRFNRATQAGKAQAATSVRAHRWASGRPPQLEEHAVAALASCLAAREAETPEVDELPLWLVTGVGVAEADPASLIRTLVDAGRTLRRVRRPQDALVPLLQLAFDISQLRSERTPVSDTPAPSAVIDVGRIRWCELSQRPVTWLPLLNEHPDTIGGPDRAWTTDPPAAGATWHGTSPALRMDPAWSARLVVVPGDPNVWCVDLDGTWWSLEVDYEAVVLARREHRAVWCDAMEWMHEAMPVKIEAARARAAEFDEQARAQRGSELPVAADSETPESTSPKRYSREWVNELASRYSYQDDADAREAGAAAAARGYFKRDEFLTVVRWKSRRVLPRAERNSAAQVEARTRAAFAASDEVARAAALVSLEGVGVPVASALLAFAFPDRYPILDFRALGALGERGRTSYSNGYWADYVERCRRLAVENGVSIRDLDKALWQASKEGDTPAPG